MKWSVLLHHNEHIHPGVTATGASGSFVVENHAVAGDTIFYEIVLIVTDSAGLTDTRRVNVIPDIPVTTTPQPTTFLSDLNWTSLTNGWGPVEKDRSNGETGATDGVQMKLQGVAYQKGLGVHANSEVRFNLNKAYKTFVSDIGIDDEVQNNGSVIFRVYGDGVLLYDSGVMTGASATKNVTIDVTGKTELRLVVSDAGDGNAYDHADWANARLLSTATAANNPPTVSLTAPSNNSTFTVPATITLRANAVDSDGTISKVEFYQGGTLINSDQAAPYEYTFTLGSVGVASFTAKAYDNKGAVTTSSAVQVNVNNAAPVNGNGSGLKGEYFRRKDLTRLSFTRTDSTVNFNWGNDSPNFLLNAEEFSVRWSGLVQPRFSGAYTFYGTSSDGVRIFINGNLLTDKLTNSGTITGSGEVNLTAGQKYRIVVEYYQPKKNKAASIKLEWSSSNQVKEVIPRSQLYTQ